eukprot:3534742-Amphidinium_carterae.1
MMELTSSETLGVTSRRHIWNKGVTPCSIFHHKNGFVDYNKQRILDLLCMQFLDYRNIDTQHHQVHQPPTATTRTTKISTATTSSRERGDFNARDAIDESTDYSVFHTQSCIGLCHSMTYSRNYALGWSSPGQCGRERQREKVNIRPVPQRQNVHEFTKTPMPKDDAILSASTTEVTAKKEEMRNDNNNPTTRTASSRLHHM